jgi:hypothetical protein
MNEINKKGNTELKYDCSIADITAVPVQIAAIK